MIIARAENETSRGFIEALAREDNSVDRPIDLPSAYRASAYPPSHYLRRVPQRRIHLFTALQLLQLGILCGCGFAEIPFVKIGFPILLFLQLLVRHKLIPCVIDKKYLEAMDRPI
nr:unnamed protein product [Spirometra erinaceieuropaei]